MKCQILFPWKIRKYFEMSAENCCLALWVQISTYNILKYFFLFFPENKLFFVKSIINLSSSAELAQRVIKVKVY